MGSKFSSLTTSAAVGLAGITVYFLLSSSSSPKNDLSIYDDADWWNPSSSFFILLTMNKVRVPYFERIIQRMSTARRDQGDRALFVADLGCGGGFVTEELALHTKDPHPRHVVGFDISHKSLDRARAHAVQTRTEIPSSSSSSSPVSLSAASSLLEYKYGSFYNVPLPPASVDAVIASDVLEHLDDLDKALAEVFRILKPGGVLAFDTINKTWWSYFTTYLVAQELLGLVQAGAHDWNMFLEPQVCTSVDRSMLRHHAYLHARQMEMYWRTCVCIRIYFTVSLITGPAGGATEARICLQLPG